MLIGSNLELLFVFFKKYFYVIFVTEKTLQKTYHAITT